MLFVVGRWDKGRFVPGQTVTGFLFMNESKLKEYGTMLKFELARRVLPEVIEFVAASSAEAQMD